MTRAYVSSECCRRIDAFRPGAEVGGRPVSKHGDYSPWPYGKRETLAMLLPNSGVSMYRYRCARAVARVLGWMEGEDA
jgi:hypothetical protein